MRPGGQRLDFERCLAADDVALLFDAPLVLEFLADELVALLLLAPLTFLVAAKLGALRQRAEMAAAMRTRFMVIPVNNEKK